MERLFTATDAFAYGFSPEHTGKENTGALQKALERAHEVRVTVPGIYDMAGTVRIPSDSTLIFEKGVFLRRVPLEDSREEGNLFINEGAYEGRRNENITLRGVHLAVNGVESAPVAPESKNVIPGLRGHIAFLYIKNLLIEDTFIADLMKKDYAIQISDFENAEVKGAHLQGLKDGVHFGPGKNFAVRDCVFCTYDDAIALNCTDYSVSNPNFGDITDGIIENCIEIPGQKTDSLFIRILVGTARPWKKGMTVYHSDAILTENGMYRVVMKPDDTPYISQTEPTFREGYCTLDGIQWARTHKGYSPEEIPLTAGCHRITCRNIVLAEERNWAVLIYTNFDPYLRSYYKGSPLPQVSDILFDNIQCIQPVRHFLNINLPVENLHILHSVIKDGDTVVLDNDQIEDGGKK